MAPASGTGDPREFLGSTLHEQAALLQATTAAHSALQDAVMAANEASRRATLLSALLKQGTDVAASRARLLPRAVTGPDPIDSLSPREREVLALVADGRSNKAIAAALYVSPNTVKTHVTSLLTKLQAGGRVQLAVIAAQQWCSRPCADGRE